MARIVMPRPASRNAETFNAAIANYVYPTAILGLTASHGLRLSGSLFELYAIKATLSTVPTDLWRPHAKEY
jgi:hypothetical protein